MSRIDELIARLCPDGVETRSLGEVARYSGQRVLAADLNERTFVGVDNLLPMKGGRVDATYRANTERVTSFAAGDVLLGNIRPYLKKVWLADRSGGCSGDVLAIQLHGNGRRDLTPDFLYRLLSSDDFFAYVMRHAKGAKMPRGDKRAILTYPVPVPPLEVQREIVTVLDTFSQLEAELEAELEARRRQYEHYRDSLLTFGEGEAEWVSLGDIGAFRYGLTARALSTGDYRFIRITDISERGKLISTGIKYVEATQDAAAYLVERDDLLVARTGATFGKTLLVDTTEPAVFASFLIRIRLLPKVLPGYYWHFAQSRYYWTQADGLVGKGSQPQFNANALKQIRLPVPPIAEQERIIGVLDAFDALVNDLSIGLPAELAARRKQYEYYRDKLLTFKELVA